MLIRILIEGFWNLTSEQGTIESPNYPQPYPSHSNLTWIINCPKTSLCVLNFVDLELADEYDKLELYTDVKLDKGRIGAKALASKYTGLWQTETSQSALPFSFSRQYVKEHGMVMIKFTSDAHNETKGFKINYRVIKSRSQSKLVNK